MGQNILELVKKEMANRKFLYKLYCQGFTLSVRKGILYVSPINKLTDELRKEIQQNKQELINLLNTFDEEEARGWLIDTTKRIMKNWPPGALMAAEGTPLYEEYRKASDAIDEAFEGEKREEFLKSLRYFEDVMMRIAESYRKR